MQYADPTKLRAYFFGNMYLSPIQQGIQAAHVVTKLFQKYGRDHESGAADALYDWADVGVTKILLNGGYQSNLADVFRIFDYLGPKLGLPYAKFHEEEAALNGALTSVGIVVPEEIYDFGVAYKYFSDNGTDTGIFRYCVNPKAPTPAEILDLLGKMLPPTERNRDITMEFYTVLLYATLKSARLA